jgi:uncharacterized protein YuzE
MQAPIDVTIEHSPDLAYPLGYVRYRRLPPGGHVHRTKRLSESVAVDFDKTGEVLGIELIGFEEIDLIVARNFAHDADLSFPADLRGTIPS